MAEVVVNEAAVPVDDGAFVHVLLSVEYCHWIVPVLPANFNVPASPVLQTVPPPVTVPPTDVGLTVIVLTALKAEVHEPLVTILLT